MQNEDSGNKYLNAFLSLSKKAEDMRSSDRIRELQHEVESVKTEYKELEKEYQQYQDKAETKINLLEEKVKGLEIENSKLAYRLKFMEITVKKYEEKESI